ncbi:MAG TPA: 4-hydroxy-3-methylbut-2-enyl diphosphate reductase [Rhizobiales bacterium]|nr:4-hydroxy-3-methylbut-2-enyl diphosphate reductase [Hyphomicrobiales bacterium]
MTDVPKSQIRLLLAAPRGFCAGVVRAIDIVEEALATYGKPVYVRHEIVHNKFVVDNLKRKGAIFVEELDEVPDGDHPVIFSAHGVPKTVPENARLRNLFYLDATCPLVSKVHMEASRHHKDGHQILLIGHEGHPEVVGTMGQLPKGAVTLIETVEDVSSFQPSQGRGLAYITQTTLSVDDTKGIIDALHERFPDINAPHKEDICYATTNRQASVKEIAHQCDFLLVVGAPNSSNSQRLVEVARTNGCPNSMLVQRAGDIDWEKIGTPETVGITAGASAPEVLVSEVIGAFQDRFDVSIGYVETAKESVTFKLPRQLRLDMKEKAVTP